ncbi:hypothetical protein INR49_001187 [Caranx melampygus]|nr:hypothetical protein INR49_001187 [Caranx melampygus]
MARLCRKPPPAAFSTPMFPHAVAVFLLLTRFDAGESQTQKMVAMLGDDIILPCHVGTERDLSDKMVEWSRADLIPRFVHMWRFQTNDLSDQNQAFKGRTSLSGDNLKKGDASLKLSRVKLADKGTYSCIIPRPNGNENSSVELDVGAASSPVISLAGTDRDKGSVVLQCESKGWYPEPELLWLDAEGKLLSAGPTQTVRGPDDLYTVSSRVTVEKRHSNSFTCRVQQKTIHQSRDTQIHVPDDFFKVQSSSAPVITALVVSIVIIVSLVFYVWKKRQNLKTKRGQRDEEEREREKLLTEEKMELQKQLEQKQDELKELQEEKKQEDEQKEVQEEKKKQEDELQQLQEEKKKKEDELKEVQEEKKKKEDELKELQDEKKKQEDELKELQDEKKKQEDELKELQDEKKKQERTEGAAEETDEADLKTKDKQLEQKQDELQWVQEEKKKQEDELQSRIKQLETKITQLEEQLQDEKKKREEVEALKKLQQEEETTELEQKQDQLQQLQEEKKKQEDELQSQMKDSDVSETQGHRDTGTQPSAQ